MSVEGCWAILTGQEGGLKNNGNEAKNRDEGGLSPA